MESIVEYLHYGTILVFGIYLSASFLGIQMNKKNSLILLAFSSVVGIINGVCFLLYGLVFTEQIYPIIVHLPLILFLTFFYKYRMISTILSVFVSYLCCQISNWIGILFLNITDLQWVYYSVRIIVDILVLNLLIYYVSNAVTQFLQKSTKEILIFGCIPFVYYVYDYITTVYTNLFYLERTVIIEFLSFMLCIFYVLFLMIYFKQYEEKEKMEQRNRILEMQRIQSEKDVERMKRSEYEISILRHDMRHFLNDIAGLVEIGEIDQALDYIHEIIDDVDKTATKKYCSNKIIDMILSSYENIMKENEIDFSYYIQIPEKLKFLDSDISSILSNGLENAVHATASLKKKERKIRLDMYINNDKLLISLKNTYGEKPKIEDGVLKAKEKGHGFGTQSIRYVTEKLKGNCQFIVDKEYFILRIVL